MAGCKKINSYLFIIITTLFGCNSQNSTRIITRESADKGQELFNSVGCVMCHSVTGEARYGPSLNSIFNSEILVIRNGEEKVLTIDREYIRRSIENPDYEKVNSFQNRKMPKPTLSPEDIDYITDYLISISEKQQN